jgi:hypothetical protein
VNQIRMFRLNAFDPVAGKRRFEFYLKAEKFGNDNKSSVICNFCVADEGVYYYTKGSKILSRKESPTALGTPNGFLSMETLNTLFQMLMKARLGRYEELNEGRLKITKKGRQVIIEEGDA